MSTTTTPGSPSSPSSPTDPAADFRHDWLELLRDELETISTDRMVAATYRTGTRLEEALAGIDADEHTCWCHAAEALTTRGGEPA